MGVIHNASQENHPEVSVVMAVYNGARFLPASLESILAQTASNLEFIIVDDGSDDETVDIVQSYHDSRIRLLSHQRNLGLAESLNHGFARARAPYIARQDADDISHPERLERQLSYLDTHSDISILGTASAWIDQQNNTTKVWPMGADNPDIQQSLLFTCPLIHGSVILRRECFVEGGSYDQNLRTGQDYDYWLRLSERWDIACLSDVLYSYRQHDEMVSVGMAKIQRANADRSRDEAVRRRLMYGWGRLGWRDDEVPTWTKQVERSWLARRYVWWSAGSRRVNRLWALQFMLIALLLAPEIPDGWRYLHGIVGRKLGW